MLSKNISKLFNKESILDSGVLVGTTDFHSHILPGVDDGIQSTADAMDVLSVYEEYGLRNVWFTPHIMEDYPNKTYAMKDVYERLCIAYRKSSVKESLTFHLASENMLDTLFVKRLESDDFLPIIDERHLLIETSFYSPLNVLYDLLEKIKARGYIPVLAHPERYSYMDMSDYSDLHSKDIKFQLNILSLCGAYGNEAKYKSQMLLKEGLYFISGSDLHSKQIFEEWVRIPIKKAVLKQLRSLNENLI